MAQEDTPMQTVWENHRKRSSNCANCPGCDAPYPLGGLGDPDADIMVVAQEPAYNVDDDAFAEHGSDADWPAAKRAMEQRRRIDINPLYKHLVNIAVAAECEPYDLYFTNVAKCDDGNSTFVERASQCKSYLIDEIASVDPELILLHGGKVIRTVLPMFGFDEPASISTVHGSVFEARSVKLLTLYHWGYAYRTGDVTKYNDLVFKKVELDA